MITDLQIQSSIKESAFGAISLSSSLFFFFLIGLIRQMSRARTTKAVRVMALKISRAFLDLYSRNRYKATPIIPIPVIHIPATATHIIIFCFWVAILTFKNEIVLQILFFYGRCCWRMTLWPQRLIYSFHCTSHILSDHDWYI